MQEYWNQLHPLVQSLVTFGSVAVTIVVSYRLGKAAKETEVLAAASDGKALELMNERYMIIEEANYAYMRYQARAWQDAMNGSIKARKAEALKEKFNAESI